MSLPPLRRKVVVACEPEVAHRVFREEIGAWWPLEAVSCFGVGARVAVENGEIIETSPEGERAVWGTLLRDEPPHTLAFTWHPGLNPEDATRVTVTFAPVPDGRSTRVTLLHDGWEAYGDADIDTTGRPYGTPESAREQYGRGWIGVLERYRIRADRVG